MEPWILVVMTIVGTINHLYRQRAVVNGSFLSSFLFVPS